MTSLRHRRSRQLPAQAHIPSCVPSLQRSDALPPRKTCASTSVRASLCVVTCVSISCRWEGCGWKNSDGSTFTAGCYQPTPVWALARVEAARSAPKSSPPISQRSPAAPPAPMRPPHEPSPHKPLSPPRALTTGEPTGRSLDGSSLQPSPTPLLTTCAPAPSPPSESNSLRLSLVLLFTPQEGVDLINEDRRFGPDWKLTIHYLRSR